jgi:MOSC domain-containing protein YiiM
VKVVSTNIGQPVTISWQGLERITGIYKNPVPEGIYLGSEGVTGDAIGNPKVHGGTLKAAYLFSADPYPFWKTQYPALDWVFGMFGENLTISELDENQLFMGSIYTLGEASVRITTPREPCFKLGLRFKDQGIIDSFVKYGRPGAYVEVLQPGFVRAGDPMELVELPKRKISIAAFFKMWYAREKDHALIHEVLHLPWISEQKQKQLQSWLS